LFFSGECYQTSSAVSARVTRPKRFPSKTGRRGKQRFRGRFQDLPFFKIHDEQTIVFLLAKISEDKTRWPEDRTIDSYTTLLAKPGIFPAQFEKIDM